MSTRREFITLLGGAATAWPLAARGQQGERIRRIGLLSGNAREDVQSPPSIAAFTKGLQALGWTDGQNLKIEYRWSAGNLDLMKEYTRELVALKSRTDLVGDAFYQCNVVIAELALLAPDKSEQPK